MNAGTLVASRLRKAAGEVLTTKQAPHRPGTAPATCLCAGALFPAQISFIRKRKGIHIRNLAEVLSALQSEPPKRVRVKAESEEVARNLRPASLEILPKPWFLPGFQRLLEVFAELLGQRSEGFLYLVFLWRAGAPARAAALSDWLFSLGLKAVCGGGGSD